MARRKKAAAAPPPVAPAPPQARVVVSSRDARPVIYWVLCQLFALAYVIVIQKVIPNRLPSATIQLWTIPICMQVMAVGLSSTFHVVWRHRPATMWVAIAVAVAGIVLGAITGPAVTRPFASLLGLYGVFGVLVALWPEWRRFGRQLAIIAGSVLLLSVIVLIARVLVSAAFLAGVYGAFGKAAATFALIAVALVVELVALLPIVCVKYLMSRAGKRAYT